MGQYIKDLVYASLLVLMLVISTEIAESVMLALLTIIAMLVWVVKPMIYWE